VIPPAHAQRSYFRGCRGSVRIAGGPGNRLWTRLALALMIPAAIGLAAGCGQSGKVKNAVSSLSPSRSVSISSPTFSERTRTPEPTPTASSQPTATVTAEQTVTATAAAPAAPSSKNAAASGSGSSLLWLWIVLGAVVIAGAALLIARHFRRRSAATADWRSKAVDAYAQGSALYDAMTMAEAPGASAAGDAGARWADIQRRTGDLTQALYALRETAPGDVDRARVADVLASLQSARSAMDAERVYGAGAPQGARVHELLLSFEASLRALRSPDGYTP
jgi:hypothetical protein